MAAAADAMIPGHSLKKIGTGIRKGVTWALTGVMLLFTGFLTLTGAASSAADALTMQMTRSAISAAVSGCPDFALRASSLMRSIFDCSITRSRP